MSPSRSRRLRRRFFLPEASEVAPALLGKLLVHRDGRAARLVEVEAYMGEKDPGSHAFRGPTPRASVMFGPPGRLYVYFTYGMHWCANVVCSPEGTASAVLLRAAEPLAGTDIMRACREAGRKKPARELQARDLCRGPARLAQAFGITSEHNGLDLAGEGASLPPVWLADDGHGPGGPIGVTPRIGLAEGRGAELPWRYIVLGSPWVSAGGARPPSGAPVARTADGVAQGSSGSP